MLSRLAACLALAALGGCTLNDCSFGDYEVVQGTRTAAATVEAPSDVLVVVFETEAYAETQVLVPAGGPALRASDDRQARVRAQVEQGGYAPVPLVELQGETRNDTLFVQIVQPVRGQGARTAATGAGEEVVRPVCSPAVPTLELRVLSAEVPDGVERVEVLFRDPNRNFLVVPGPEAEAERVRSVRL